MNGNTEKKTKDYKIKVDKEEYLVTQSAMTGAEILALAGKTPDKWLLRMKVHGKVEPVEPGQTVSFETSGVERFMTVPNTVKEGDGTPPRREFPLLDADGDYLEGLGLRWECLKEGSQRMVVIYGWTVPSGYSVKLVDLHLRLSELYPDTEIDMAYFSPALARADGRAINGLSTLQFDGRTWQQWSRHRTPESKWRAGEDDLSTHMALVDHWLRAELLK